MNRSALLPLLFLCALVSTTATAAPKDDPDLYGISCERAFENWEICDRNDAPESCDAMVIRDYTSKSLYKELNPILRGTQKERPACLSLVEKLKAALTRVPTEAALTVYRGTSAFPALMALKPSECLIDPAFVSASKKEDVAQTFAHTHLWEIQSRNGRSVRAFSEYPNEEEVLFLPGTAFRLRFEPLTVEKETKLVFEEVDPKDCAK